MKQKDVKIYMPNEIFEDFKSSDFKNSPHIAYAYSFYYYINYLYRYCLYNRIDNKKITMGQIKQKLGYSSINKQIDYITKKNGVLDQLGYTETTTDYPLSVTLDEFQKPEFLTISQFKEDIITPYIINDRNYKIKIPVKGFYRTVEAKNDLYRNGTFYEVENTHAIQYSIFDEIISNEELGTIGFYVYGYLKYRSDMFVNGFQTSINRLSIETGLSREVINNVTKRLAFLGLIDIEFKKFGLELKRDEWEANIYTVN